MCWRTGRYAEAFRASDLQMEITQELGATNNANRASWLSDRGLLLKTVHRYEEARECLTEAIALSELRSHLLPWTSALADVEAESGNIRRAVALSDKAAAAITRDEWPHLEGTERGALVANRTKAVAYYLMLGELDAARRAVVDAFDLASTRWAGISIVTHLCLAATIAMSGDVTRGARMKAYVDAYYASNGIVRLATDERTYQFLADALAESSTDPEVQRAAAEGAALNWEQAADLGAAMAKTLRALA
jgi:tetratricopeptide (TPR) repeat protein